MRSNLTGIRALALAVVLAAGCTRSNSGPTSLQEVRTLAALPNGITEALGTSKKGVEGVADSGANFNATDVVSEPLPFRRLILAGVGATHAVVALEHGGRGYRLEIYTFDLKERQWVQTRAQIFLGVEKPTDLAELLNLSAKAGHEA